jgi:hypothetical protein
MAGAKVGTIAQVAMPPNADLNAQYVARLSNHIDNVAFHIDRVAKGIEKLTPHPEPIGFWHRFVAEMHAPDWIQTVLMLIALGALIFTALALKESSRGRDVENHLKFMSLIREGWNDLARAAEADRYRTFLDLMNLWPAPGSDDIGLS